MSGVASDYFYFVHVRRVQGSSQRTRSDRLPAGFSGTDTEVGKDMMSAVASEGESDEKL